MLLLEWGLGVSNVDGVSFAAEEPEAFKSVGESTCTKR